LIPLTVPARCPKRNLLIGSSRPTKALADDTSVWRGNDDRDVLTIRFVILIALEIVNNGTATGYRFGRIGLGLIPATDRQDD
jgi:hypothetical protein